MDPEDGGINLPDSQDGIRRGDGADEPVEPEDNDTQEVPPERESEE